MPPEVPSPCNKICTLTSSALGQVCIGCGRHIDEIAFWSGASDEQRLAIRERAAARLAAMQKSQNPEKPHG